MRLPHAHAFAACSSSSRLFPRRAWLTHGARAIAVLVVLVAAAPAQLQFDELLQMGRLPLDSDRTNAVAWVDVDGDGDPDLVFGNRGQNRLYRNLLRQLRLLK